MEALSVLLSFYSQDSSRHDKVLPLSKAINLNMSRLKHKTSPKDPSNFLWALWSKISKDHGSPSNFNSQHDVPEILQILIDQSNGIYLAAGNIISYTLQTSFT